MTKIKKYIKNGNEYCLGGSSGGSGGGYIGYSEESPATWIQGADFALATVSGGNGILAFDKDEITSKVMYLCYGTYTASNNGIEITGPGKTYFFSKQAHSNNPGYIDFMLVGGGGNGGTGQCVIGGGSGGDILEIVGYPILDNTIYMSVGCPGNNTKIFDYIALAGKSGCASDSSYNHFAYGGNSTNYIGGRGSRCDAFNRSGSCACYDYSGGGGAGVCGDGTNGIIPVCRKCYIAGNGGAGYTTNFSGKTETFGGGGGGGIGGYYAGYSGAAPTLNVTTVGVGNGGGGNGGINYYVSGGICCYVNATPPTSCGSGGGGGGCISSCNKGAGGLIIIRYKTDGSCGILPTSFGGNKYQCGDYTYHCFTDYNSFQKFYVIYKK